ncbi:hypothetical protein HZH68_004293 [Vespula germanica]|uniref:Uncharacterized protein n=1 Tax=Vespula germanica TaxID=30212 RepID=A0A834KNP0_VESGE|nr:hypothetical protein HZH68_004293 [Vespula germanica]
MGKNGRGFFMTDTSSNFCLTLYEETPKLCSTDDRESVAKRLGKETRRITGRRYRIRRDRRSREDRLSHRLSEYAKRVCFVPRPAPRNMLCRIVGEGAGVREEGKGRREKGEKEKEEEEEEEEEGRMFTVL